MTKRAKPKITGIVFFGLAAIGFALAFAAILYWNTIYPDSVDTDTFGHLFKSNYLYHSLKEGNWYPIYTEYWYNAMELFRYWPPLSYYVLALLQFCTGGDVLNAFYLFAGVVYLINMMGWLTLGKSENCLLLAFITGNLYFFCPDNIRIFMGEGNTPRIFITALLPYVFYFVWEIVHYEKRKKLIGLACVIWMITLTHYMIAAMTGITIFIFCMVYALMNKKWCGIVFVTVDLVLAYLSAGIFLIPGLTGGGLTSQNSEASIATINQWAQEALKSLNPFYRVRDGYVRNFYFGIAIFIIVLLGIIAANKKTGPGFVTTLLIFVSTTTTASMVVRLLPMSQVFWMQRFVPMAMCIFFFSVLLWKQLKKSVIMIFVMGMLLDSATTAKLLIELRQEPIGELVEQEMSDYLLPEAVKLTQNRLGILDNSIWGAIPSWYLSKDMNEDSVPFSFGWAYQGAETIDNIVSINEAAQEGFYEFVFDRLLELGDDTVLVDKSLFMENNVDGMKQAARLCGYTLIQENDKVWLYHLENAEGTFGVKKKYRNLAIGQHAEAICYIYPEFAYSNRGVLEDYTLEELVQYEKIYLSGFTYRDKATAEKLLLDAAAQGVKIYIDMQHIPLNALLGKAEFLNVYAQHVEFTEKFPIMSTNNGSQFKLNFQEAGYPIWNTVYLAGAQNSLKEAYYDKATRLTYVAQNDNPNITFLGFNTIYYYKQNRMPELLIFLNEVFEEEPGRIAESEIVPITVSYEKDKITICTESDEVNTGIAALDCFEVVGNEEKSVYNQLLMVNQGTTVFAVKYSDFAVGMLVSVIGVLGSIIYWWFLLVVYKGGSNR